ncbi:serine/threonine protein kinase [Nocardioides sp. J9]|uniref:serine/threonine-protein kinase n=1 Tax=Nocardioides sp. J9 TaxID=935844 RepID=UPI0011A5F9C2|nr:serine/threonine-protein kinase [Nocardioides sp. J9]TWG96238.1 serine/threonine protein kinase [Nocardioides sp. J9]
MSTRRVADRYALRRAVGHGASGAVWLAHDELLGRPVAVKRTGPGPGYDGHTAQVEREARLAAQLGHPNVVAVYDLAIDEEGAWLVMEYVDGPPLSTVVREAGPLSPDEAARLVAPVADALAHAHELGIVHRDVKPSNILSPGDGGAKLSDFGIARGADDATLTATGMVTGSPAYLAPEVARGGQATPASDVWALGATLVHLLTGRPPYHRDGMDNGPFAVVHRIVTEDPPVVPDADWLAPLIADTMQHDPEARPSMRDVRDRLERTGRAAAEQTMALPPVPPPPPPPPAYPPPGYAPAPLPEQRRHRSRVATTIAAGSAAAVAAIAVLALQGGGDSDPPASATTTTTEGVAQSESSGPTEQPAPTAEQLEEFARSYVRTADTDPSAGLRMLTPAYRKASPDYADFWGPMRNPRILRISADPAAMTVTYTYRYQLPREGSRTEEVTLVLEEHDGDLLIAGAE